MLHAATLTPVKPSVAEVGSPLGHYVARSNSVRFQAVGALLLGSGFALHAVTRSPGTHMLPVMVWTMGASVGYSTGKSVAAKLGPAHLRGSSIRFIGSMSGLAMLIGRCRAAGC